MDSNIDIIEKHYIYGSKYIIDKYCIYGSKYIMYEMYGVVVDDDDEGYKYLIKLGDKQKSVIKLKKQHIIKLKSQHIILIDF